MEKNLKNLFEFSKESLGKLKRVHPELVEIVKEALLMSKYDFRVVCGVRELKSK